MQQNWKTNSRASGKPFLSSTRLTQQIANDWSSLLVMTLIWFCIGAQKFLWFVYDQFRWAWSVVLTWQVRFRHQTMEQGWKLKILAQLRLRNQRESGGFGELITSRKRLLSRWTRSSGVCQQSLRFVCFLQIASYKTSWNRLGRRSPDQSIRTMSWRRQLKRVLRDMQSVRKCGSIFNGQTVKLPLRYSMSRTPSSFGQHYVHQTISARAEEYCQLCGAYISCTELCIF